MAVEQLRSTSRQTSLSLVAYEGPAASDVAVVALHGLGVSTEVLATVRPGFDPYRRLADEGCHVLALDWPGHGRSGGPRGHLSYRLAMDAAAAAVGVAQARWGLPVTLFGSGLGGVLAFYATLEDERVAAVACHNVLDLRDVRPLARRAVHRGLLPAAAVMYRWLEPKRLRRIRLPARLLLAPADLAEDPALARRLWRHPAAVRWYDLAGLGSILLSPDDKPDLRAQARPTFIAVGGNDRVLTETASKAFAHRLTCSHELLVLPGAGHQLLLEHSRALLPAAAAFLGKHAA